MSSQVSRAEQWTAGEKVTFHRAFSRYGQRWKKVAKCLPNRTARAVENYYHAKYKLQQRGEGAHPKVNWWTLEEDRLLRDMVEKHPGEWEKIVAVLPGRTVAAAREHYRCLRKQDPIAFESDSGGDADEEGKVHGADVEESSSAESDADDDDGSTHTMGLDQKLEDEAWLLENLKKKGSNSSPVSRSSTNQRDKAIKKILRKVGFSEMVMADARCLRVVATKLVHSGIPSRDRLTSKERCALELWIRRTSCVDEDLLLMADDELYVSLTDKETIWLLTEYYCGDPVFLKEGGKVFFLNRSSGSGTPPSFSLDELRFHLRSDRERCRLKTKSIADLGKRLALQLWVASSPHPLPVFEGDDGAVAVESSLIALKLN